ncbi:unnamed protein product [Adineta steineri]|uniref:Uncharacterized protein n=1 Tax=Adineta steineri TaxID=433720 RepID=A0A813Z2R4_9BILA|nr:unnamed protein product [Adineta steineri]CAF0892586.1 unnamed protein product [Adineta steineri]
MTKIISVIIATVILHITIDHCQAWDKSDSKGNQTRTYPVKVNKSTINNNRHQYRIRRQQGEPSSNSDTAAAVLSILPLDRIGTIVGQIMATGLKEMLSPDVGKKIVNVLENQAPLLVTSLFSNLLGTLSGPVRSTSTKTNVTTSSISLNNNAIKQLTNVSTSEIINAIRQPGRK